MWKADWFERLSMDTSSARVYVQNALNYEVIINRQCPLADPVQVFTVPASAYGYLVTVNVDGYEFNFNNMSFESKICGDDYARPVKFIKLNPRQAFIHACEDDPMDPVIIQLSDYDIRPGYKLLLEVMGDYTDHMWEDFYSEAIAVFSSSSQLLPYEYRYRVPGAINAGDQYEHVSSVTAMCNTPRDITQDFGIEPVAIITVPAGATHLFLGTSDSYYADNRDANGDFGINLSVLKKE